MLFTILSFYSIIQTNRIDQANPYSEIINYDHDSVLINLLLIAFTAVGALIILRNKIYISKINTNFIICVMLFVTTTISLTWIILVKSNASGDSMLLLNTARDAAQNKYDSFFHSYNYYGNYSYYLFYPFQLGYVFFAEILYRIFGTACSDTLFQIPNVIALDFIYVGLIAITSKLFNRKSVTNLTAFSLIVCLQPMFMTTFTYGILPGLAFSIWSVYHVISFMKNGKIKNVIFATLLISVSVLLKYNNMIILAAICIALILHAIDKKKLLALALVAAMIIGSVALQKLVIFSYSARSGAELNTQVSQTMYAYMGIGDSGMALGWYNGKAMETMRDNQMDVKKANKVATQGIKE